MEIRRLSLILGALRAEGLTVIIDVFRAFTTAAYVMDNGAKGIIPVATVEEATILKDEDDDLILMGEVDGVKVEGFDYGNSPHEVKKLDFTGKKLVQRTSAGTQGIICARNADEILLGSFVTADAIVDYIKALNPVVVSLVAMGWGGRETTPEDEYLAEYLELKLKGESPNFHEMRDKIRRSPHGAKFFDPAQPQFAEGDYHAAMDLNRFNFVLRVKQDNGLLVEKVQKDT
jgi:2-phosphosulfolactate phosphatase